MQNGETGLAALQFEVAQLGLELNGYHEELRDTLEDGMARGAFDYPSIRRVREDIRRVLIELSCARRQSDRLRTRSGLRLLPFSRN